MVGQYEQQRAKAADEAQELQDRAARAIRRGNSLGRIIPKFIETMLITRWCHDIGQGNLTGTRQQPWNSGRDKGIWLDTLVELLKICDANQIIIMLKEVLVSEASGFEPGATSFVTLMVATVMTKVQQPGVGAILELLVVDLNSRQLFLQLFHPHSCESCHLWISPHVVWRHLKHTRRSTSSIVRTSVQMWWAHVDVEPQG